jgi:hypothetical protein
MPRIYVTPFQRAGGDSGSSAALPGRGEYGGIVHRFFLICGCASKAQFQGAQMRQKFHNMIYNIQIATWMRAGTLNPPRNKLPCCCRPTPENQRQCIPPPPECGPECGTWVACSQGKPSSPPTTCEYIHSNNYVRIRI